MNKILLTLLLLSTLPGGAAPPNQADFPITVHVVYARMEGTGSRIGVLIEDQPMELSGSASGVLKLGDYPARVSPKINAPKNWSPYDLYKGYDFLMPDGKVRTYYLTAIGTPPVPASANNP